MGLKFHQHNKQQKTNLIGGGRKETPTQRKRRLDLKNQKSREKRANESEAVKNARLSKRRKQNEAESEEQRAERRRQKSQLRIRQNETDEQHASRLAQVRESTRARRENETEEQHASRLAQVRESTRARRENETEEHHASRLVQVRELARIQRENETEQQHASRLGQARELARARRENETEEHHASRLVQARESTRARRENETEEHYASRLEQVCESMRARREQQNASIEAFKTAINTFCDQVCDVCKKMCYPNQITRCTPSNAALSYLPDDLVDKGVLDVCYRCKTHITGNKQTHPPKAYWNSLDPGEIPEEIKDLTLFERRLLSRIKAFVKVVRLHGRFGQLGFKGQAILFAQDIFEVTETLPNMLPISTQESGMVVVTEHLENIDCSREFTVSRDRIFRALHWLVDNNPLYQDVTIDPNARIEQSDLIRVQEPQREPQEPRGQYKNCNTLSRILHASHHQGNSTLYPETGGRQCCAMSLANIVRASIVPPRQWSKMMYDENMFSGDAIYQQVVRLCNALPQDELPVDERIGANGYLSVRNIAVIKDDFVMFEKSFSFNCANYSPWYGNLRDTLNNYSERNDNGELQMRPLKKSLEMLFSTHCAGILITEKGQCFGVLFYDSKYYFTDSHACGDKGARPRNEENGNACVIECNTFDEFHRVCKRATTSVNTLYTLDYIDVRVNEDDAVIEEEQIESNIPIQQFETTPIGEQLNSIPIQTSMMAPTDAPQPELEDILEVSDNLNEIRRKTTNNIVNIRHEPKHEEFAWFHLFPYGKNGLKEDSREVSITTLDYFQSRILSNDPRFQSSDYLFYALSMKELGNVKSMISTCAKKVRNQDGAIEDLHLIMRNIRGSSAYWRNALIGSNDRK